MNNCHIRRYVFSILIDMLLFKQFKLKKKSKRTTKNGKTENAETLDLIDYVGHYDISKQV
jgi:hypothetical protein